MIQEYQSTNLVTSFQTKTGKEAVVRYAQVQDAQDLMDFINVFSVEDSFTRFAGEQMSFEEEETYLQSEARAMKKGDAVKLFCYVDEQLAGVCDVHRDTSLLTRKRHVGTLGLIVGKDFRGQGIGEQLIKITISQAKKDISNLKIIQLGCFANNTTALSLYKKVGFTEVGRIPKSIFYKNEYIDEVVMTKECGNFS